VFEIQLLSNKHNREEFDCGVQELNTYLRTTVCQHIEKGISKTFVAVEEEVQRNIIGFFTLTVGEINREILGKSLAKKLPGGNLPAIKLARLAISHAFQGGGIGEALLFESMRRAYLTQKQVGAIALFVDAKDSGAATFYAKYGFIATEQDPLHLYIQFQTIAALVETDC